MRFDNKIFYFGIIIILFFSMISCLIPAKHVIVNNNQSFDMLIITLNCYVDEVQPLVDHKNMLGVSTYIKSLEYIENNITGRDLQEKIKYYIQSAIEQFSISYVLLIGSAKDIPGRYTHIYFDEPFDYPTPDEWVFTSDFYYADIYDSSGHFSSWDSNNNDIFAEYHWNGQTDEIDLIPDIYLGRLACVDKNQIQTCINKIITYETEKAWCQEWFTNLILVGGDGIPYDEESIDEGEYLQEFFIDIMDGFVPIRLWASNQMLSDAYNINTAINQGAGFVFFNGHGFNDLWGTYIHNRNVMVPPGYYRTEHINKLTNDNRLPVVISDACYHLEYDSHPDCFGWSFVTNPNGGAIAFIGGSDTDLALAGSRIVEKGVEKLDLHLCRLYQLGIIHLGELWGQGIIDYEPVDIVDSINILQNHLFGDPSLMISEASNPPLRPDPPIGPSEGKVHSSYNFSIGTSDPDGDKLYYLVDWGDDSILEWIGPYNSGEKCIVSHIWTIKNTFQIKVKAKDIHGVQSEWSEPVDINLPKHKCLLNCLNFLNDSRKVHMIFPMFFQNCVKGISNMREKNSHQFT